MQLREGSVLQRLRRSVSGSQEGHLSETCWGWGRSLSSEVTGRGWRGCGGPLGAAQGPVVELPEQLLLLQGEALIALALLLQRLLQDRLLHGELPGNRHVLVHLSCKFFMLLLELLQFVHQCLLSSTSFSIFIHLTSRWCSLSFLISNTAFRLSHYCSRYMI